MVEDGGSTIMQLFILVVLILMNAFFAMSEMAIISLNDNKIKKMAEEGNKKAKKIVNLTKEPSKFLATIQVGVTLAGLLTSAVAAESFAGKITAFLIQNGLAIDAGLLRGIIVVILTIVLSYFTLVFGELVPKRIAMQYPEPISMAVIGVLTVVEFLMRPFVKFLTASTNFIIRLMGGNPDEHEEHVTEEEIRMMVDLGEEKGVIDETEKEMIDNIFEFDNTTASEAMTHRKDIVAFDVETTIGNVIEKIQEEQFTRFPIYEEDIDNIIGIIHVKDILRKLRECGEDCFTIRDIMRQTYYVPKSKKIDEVFKEMQKNKVYMSVVIDEYGGTSGIVTIEDLLEEIVGNIFDEYDGEEESEFEQLDLTTYLVDGTVTLSAVAKHFDKKLPDDEYETLCGFIMGHLGIVPDEGTKPEFEFNGLLFKVEDIEEKRITKVKIAITGEDAESLDAETEEKEY